MSEKSDTKIKEIVQSIKDVAKFEYYYIQDENKCFRRKVNDLYIKVLERKYWDSGLKKGYDVVDSRKDRFIKKAQSIKGDDVRLLAPIAVHNNYLEEAQKALEQCLQSLDAELLNNLNKNVTFPVLDTTDYPDPNTPLISPFDKRLNRLIVDETKKSVYPIVPA